MAKTRVTCTGHRKTSDTGTASRLGSEAVSARLATWQVAIYATLHKDGTGLVEFREINGHGIARMVIAAPQTDDLGGPTRYRIEYGGRDLFIEAAPAETPTA
jgi:hypothetical protein